MTQNPSRVPLPYVKSSQAAKFVGANCWTRQDLSSYGVDPMHVIVTHKLPKVLSLLGLCGLALVTTQAACSSDAASGPLAGAADAAKDSGKLPPKDANAAPVDAQLADALSPLVDAGSEAGDPTPLGSPWCAALANKHDVCDGERQCGANFGAWCDLQSKTNSAAFEKADAPCLNMVEAGKNSCKNEGRTICRYARYQEADITSEQKQTLTAYCAQCPSPNCEASLKKYRAGTTPEDAFVAVWELSDTITQAIRQGCLTSPGTGGSTCAKDFGSCAATIYLDALPECP
jgi:hypothetical protein